MKGVVIFAGKKETVEVPGDWSVLVWGVGRVKSSIPEKFKNAVKIVVGSCGAIRHDFTTGDVLLPAKVALLDNGKISSFISLKELPPGVVEALREKGMRVFKGGSLITSTAPVFPEDKARWIDVADAVDMETFHIASKFTEVVSIRIISDLPKQDPLESWKCNLQLVREKLKEVLKTVDEVMF